MATDKIITRKDGPVAHLVFNNPAKHNAMSIEMWEATEQHLDDFIADDKVRIIVLSGEGGKAFVSGADISEFDSARASQDAVAHYEALTARVLRFTLRRRQADGGDDPRILHRWWPCPGNVLRYPHLRR